MEKLVCIECGFKSQKGGKCWDEYNTCGKCTKSKILTCECGAKSNHRDAICWQSGVCGECYKKKYKVIKIPNYSICECGETLVALRYQKRGVWVMTRNKFCTKCQKAFMYDSRHIVVIKGLCHNCFKSGVDLIIVNGTPICNECNTKNT